jgi:hypothetical protein
MLCPCVIVNLYEWVIRVWGIIIQEASNPFTNDGIHLLSLYRCIVVSISLVPEKDKSDDQFLGGKVSFFVGQSFLLALRPFLFFSFLFTSLWNFIFLNFFDDFIQMPFIHTIF